MRKGVLIVVAILLVIFLFVRLSDLKYQPVVIIQANRKLKTRSLCDSEIAQKRIEWGKIEHPGWSDVRFVNREDGIFSHMVKKRVSERSLLRMWIQHPILFAKQVIHTVIQKDYPRWKEFDVLGPVFPEICRLKKLGKTRDEEKYICWDEQVFQNLDCVVFSIGSNNQWSFEQDVLNTTRCRVFTFDCTIEPQVPKGVRFYPFCISGLTMINGKGQIFRTIDDLIEQTQVNRLDYLKIDVEGAEFEALIPFLQHKNTPKQIALEIHYQAPTFDLDENALLAFGNFMFYEAGYVIAHRSDNPQGYFATEILFVKINC